MPEAVSKLRTVGAVVAGYAVVIVLSIASEPAPIPQGAMMAELTFVEAGQVASEPTWYTFVLPFVGLAGVLVGGRLRRPSTVV